VKPAIKDKDCFYYLPGFYFSLLPKTSPECFKRKFDKRQKKKKEEEDQTEV
jgi:hypothetical protein